MDEYRGGPWPAQTHAGGTQEDGGIGSPRTGLLRQHDYTAEVFGGWAKAANVVLEHGERDGVLFASKRRVTPRRGDGRPRRWPLLVAIDVHDWQLV